MFMCLALLINKGYKTPTLKSQKTTFESKVWFVIKSFELISECWQRELDNKDHVRSKNIIAQNCEWIHIYSFTLWGFALFEIKGRKFQNKIFTSGKFLLLKLQNSHIKKILSLSLYLFFSYSPKLFVSLFLWLQKFSLLYSSDEPDKNKLFLGNFVR